MLTVEAREMQQPRRKQPKILPLSLEGDDYAKLEREALASDRDPLQQARWLLKQALQHAPAENAEPRVVPA